MAPVGCNVKTALNPRLSVQDLAQGGSKGVRVPRLAILAAQETGVVAGEGDRRRSKRSAMTVAARLAIWPSDSAPEAMTIRVDAARRASKSGW